MPAHDYYKPVKPCPHNGGVGCPDTSKCKQCGWNPVVAAERLRKIKETGRIPE